MHIWFIAPAVPKSSICSLWAETAGDAQVDKVSISQVEWVKAVKSPKMCATQATSVSR